MIAYTKPTAPAVVVATARLTLRTWPRWLVAIAVHIAVLALFSLLTVVRAPGILAHPDSMVAPDGIDPVYHV